LHSIPIFGPPGLIEVTRLNGMSANRSGLLVRRSTLVLPHHVTKVRGIDCTAVPRTVFDLARLAGPKALDRAIEHVLRHDMCTVGALHVVTAELGGRGRPGTVKMRTALEARDEGYLPSDSELTALGRQVLSSVPGIEWEVEISDERGYIRRVDAWVRAAGLVIEFDGRRWHGQPSDVRRDEEGDMRLEALGLVVVRLTWAELTRRADAVVVKVLRLAGGGAA
jgi:hypothetical protein